MLHGPHAIATGTDFLSARAFLRRYKQSESFFVYNLDMSVALGLFRLQQVDSRLSQVDARLERIRATLENDEELSRASEDVRHRQAEIDRLERTRRSEEYEAEAQQSKIQQAESNLYGGGIRNPKELQDLQADVASLKKHLAALEERELESMVGLEVAQGALDGARQQLSRVEARLRESHAALIDERERLLHDRNDLEAEREAAKSPIAAHLLEIYEGLRSTRRGVAVAEVSENACTACGTTLTAALQQSARHAAELVYCPSCGRILYGG